MKDQYFGDLYDYIKYALLRRLSNEGEIAVGLCWMLTDADGSNDGHRIGYVDEYEKWRSLDPAVFDCLTGAIDRGERDTRIIEKSGLMPNTRFHPYTLTRNPDTRQAFMDGFLKRTKRRPLLCFDPDNGVASKDPKPGNTASPKHLLMREVVQAYKEGHSLLIFQHMPMDTPYATFIEGLAARLLAKVDAPSVSVFRVPQTNAAFFFMPQGDVADWYGERLEGWGEGLLEVRRFTRAETPADDGDMEKGAETGETETGESETE